MRFEEALAYVAKRSSLRIPAQKEAPAFYQKFLAEVLDDATAVDPYSVVFIESTRSAGMWRRLADKSCEFGIRMTIWIDWRTTAKYFALAFHRLAGISG